MGHNPDIYLLYEYSDKIPYSLRVKVRLDEVVDADILSKTARKAFTRFPYYNVQVGVDGGDNYTLEPNNRPLAVFPEGNRRVVLGSDEVNGHLFVITYKDDSIWFSCSHSICGGFGIMFWVKTTLYLYLCERYDDINAPTDLRLPGTPITMEESFFPDATTLPKDEPIYNYNGGDCNIALGRILKYIFNPFSKDNYFYEIDIPSSEFMDYAKSIDASPNTLICAMMYKALLKFYKNKYKGDISISGRIAADYRDDIGANQSYRDFVRLIHVKFDPYMSMESLEKLNLVARGAVIKQNQPELGFDRFRKLEQAHRGIDRQPTLKQKKKYAKENSTFRNDPRDAFTISYVGELNLGEMEKHIKGIYTITDGDFMLEVNALKDKFCISFQLIDKNREPFECFLSILDGVGISYEISEMKKRYLPKIKLL
ncbi:MAG: hypothetical protein IJ675_01715 [Pseudobutyrivibrio sp.]|nr:hypothetical protein [Pseudobutyrivibrio sp.]